MKLNSHDFTKKPWLILINYFEAGITAPLYCSSKKSLISCEFNTSKRALISS